MQKECKISSDANIWLCYSPTTSNNTACPTPQTCYILYYFLVGIVLVERNYITQRVFSHRKVHETSIVFLKSLIAISLQIYFIPSTHHQKTPWQGNSLLKFGVHSTSSFLFCLLLDYSSNKREMCHSFSLLYGSSLLGSLVLLPLVCQAAAHMKQTVSQGVNAQCCPGKPWVSQR